MRRSILYLVALNLTTFGLTLWNSFNNPNLIQYKLVQLVPADQVNTRLGLYALAGSLVAAIIQPVIGTLSDRTRTRFGRRIPYMTVGVIGAVLALSWIAAAPDATAILIGIMFGQIASNAVQGPWQALSPDQVLEVQMGMSAGLKTVFELLAVVISGIIVNQLLAHGYLAGAVIVVSLVSLISTMITIGVARSTNDLPKSTQEAPVSMPISASSALASLIGRLRTLPLSSRSNLIWWLINRFLFFAGLTVVRQFVINDLRDVGHYSENEALSIYGTFTILLGVGIVLVTLPAGYISDRFGRKRLIATSSLVACAGAVLLIFVRQAEPLYLVAILAGAGIGIYFSTNWAMVTALVPVRDAALFLGIANMATTLGGAVGQLGGPLIDTINVAAHSTVGYTVLFILAAICFALSALAINRVREPRPVSARTA